MGTQLVAVRGALIDALATLPAYTTVGPTGQKPEVSFGWRGSKWKRREKVWTQRARFTHEPASLRAGKTFTNEVGYFDLLIFVHGIGLDQETTSARAAELGDAAWDWAQTHTSWEDLAVPGLTELLVVGDGQVLEGVDGSEQPLAEMTLPVRYKARLT